VSHGVPVYIPAYAKTNLYCLVTGTRGHVTVPYKLFSSSYYYYT